MPGLYRTGDAKPPDPHEEPLPLTVYLPGRLLDMAEALAMRHGAATTQDYCERLLSRAITHEHDAARAETVQITHGTMISLDDLASDTESLVEWAASSKPDPAPTSPDSHVSFEMNDSMTFTRGVILRHAGLGDPDAPGVLPTLRRGDVLRADEVDELVAALSDLETSMVGATTLDRRLAYALHRLAFEGQVLLTDSLTEAASDPATIDRLRRVQEGVDRVLSGEDVRYFPESASVDDLR